LPIEPQQTEQKFFDYADRVASCGFMRRSTTVSQASQAMINRWHLETSAAGTSGGRKANQRIAPNAEQRSAKSANRGYNFDVESGFLCRASTSGLRRERRL
jgi:hypothetical protein